MAVIMLVVFALTLHIAPSSGAYGLGMTPALNWNFIWSVITHYQPAVLVGSCW